MAMRAEAACYAEMKCLIAATQSSSARIPQKSICVAWRRPAREVLESSESIKPKYVLINAQKAIEMSSENERAARQSTLFAAPNKRK